MAAHKAKSTSSAGTCSQNHAMQNKNKNKQKELNKNKSNPLGMQ